MKNIKIMRCLSIMMLLNVFCACIYAQENVSDEQNNTDKNERCDTQDRQAIASQNENEKLERLKKHYEALDLTQDTDLEKVTQAYHNLAAQAHKTIQSKRNVIPYYDGEHVVKVYCVRHVNNNASSTQDRLDYGYDYIEAADADRDEVVAAQEKLRKIREAYEAISGKKLEKIKKIKKELTTKGLDQKELNNEIRPFSNKNFPLVRYFPGLLHIIQEKRKQAQLNLQQDLDEDDFVLGESNQDASYLSEENKIKAQAYVTMVCLSEENKIKARADLEKNIAEKKQLQINQFYADQGLIKARIFGSLAIMFLVARTILLRE